MYLLIHKYTYFTNKLSFFRIINEGIGPSKMMMGKGIGGWSEFGKRQRLDEEGCHTSLA